MYSLIIYVVGYLDDVFQEILLTQFSDGLSSQRYTVSMILSHLMIFFFSKFTCASKMQSDIHYRYVRLITMIYFYRYTCVYLACKVEEFNVSIQQFVGNMHGDQEKASDLILSQELLLMHQLHYHLTVHNPFRPVEGLIIDIKVRRDAKNVLSIHSYHVPVMRCVSLATIEITYNVFS